MSRCTARLEARLPDIPQHVGHTLVLQCTKEAGHGGQHRTQSEPVFWTEEGVMAETPTNAVLVQAALTVVRQHLDEGDPVRWVEDIAEYAPDMDPPPEAWIFHDYQENFYVYSDGTMERFDNAPVSIEALEGTAIAVLSALARAYEVRDALWDGEN